MYLICNPWFWFTLFYICGGHFLSTGVLEYLYHIEQWIGNLDLLCQKPDETFARCINFFRIVCTIFFNDNCLYYSAATYHGKETHVNLYFSFAKQTFVHYQNKYINE